jgi:hypothetical protein
LHSQIASAPPQALAQASRRSIFPLSGKDFACDSGGAIAPIQPSLTDNTSQKREINPIALVEQARRKQIDPASQRNVTAGGRLLSGSLRK